MPCEKDLKVEFLRMRSSYEKTHPQNTADEYQNYFIEPLGFDRHSLTGRLTALSKLVGKITTVKSALESTDEPTTA
jgi:hypothetical protein